MPVHVPVYEIQSFHQKEHSELYANILSRHVREHRFTNLPHRHDFYLLMAVTRGTGFHEIDFRRHTVKPGSVFMLQPGQIHYWKFSEDIEGYIFFHSANFYNEGFTLFSIHDFPFFSSFRSATSVRMNKKQLTNTVFAMKEIVAEFSGTEKYRLNKIHSLITLVYIEVARAYIEVEPHKSSVYLSKLNELEREINISFRELKSPSAYAERLHLSEKHLNRIVKSTLNKTTTELIADRIVLEAKRLLIHSDLTVTEVGFQLGFNDKSYFVRFFKKHGGETPHEFAKRYKNRR